MQRITAHQAYPLFDRASTRTLERWTAAALPAHTLMQRAGRSVAQLALALAPHARVVWVACGPGNNGGDGLEAACHLQRSGRQVVVTWLGSPDLVPADAHAAWMRAQQAGVTWADAAPGDLGVHDLCIDALFGIGVSTAAPATRRAPDPRMHACLLTLQRSPAPVLAVDVPSGLDADTGQFADALAIEPYNLQQPHSPRHTLSLLTLKPGLFTAAGRDAAGQVWFDDLGTSSPRLSPMAWLSGPPETPTRAHATHKGTFGDVAVVGGEGLLGRGMGMTGAALLAASAALHGGAGRVMVALLDNGHLECDPMLPELMVRHFERLALEHSTVVCGCGGGVAVARVMREVVERSARLVLDADALNTLATDATLHALVVARGQHGRPTVLTPHPLEAARLLGWSTSQVQANRLGAARQLAAQYRCVAVLKGSGTVVAAPDRIPAINPTGNALLATAGTGDVLAGFIGARLTVGGDSLHAAREAVFLHGLAADHWPSGRPLSASALARRLSP
jgi:hydroxyethylthiazole kinase-like uncharacterized protein yjeF